MRREFQMSEPAPVRRVNFTRFIRVTPAGSEISDRKMGIIRPKKTVHEPCLSKKASVRMTSFGLTNGSALRIFRVRSRPSNAPSAYNAKAPTSEPAVHQRMAPSSVNPAPAPAEKPARGRIISEGRGGKRFSNAMRKPAPGPPRASMMLMAQPAIPPSSGVVWAAAETSASGAREAEVNGVWTMDSAASVESRVDLL